MLSASPQREKDATRGATSFNREKWSYLAAAFNLLPALTFTP